MKLLQKLFSRHFYRSITFWSLFTLALYSLIGFIALPKIIKNTITAQVSEQLGWQTEIQKISLNPFLFTLTIEQFAIKDKQQTALSFDKFHADFELRSLLEGAFTFANVSLQAPQINVTIQDDGSTNIQQALSAQQTTNQPVNSSATDAPFSLPKLLFDNISVIDGSISATDNSQQEPLVHQLNPISFQLKAFSTYIEKGGDYQLHISLGNEQSLDWQGNIAVAPVSSTGSFAIKGIKAERFWRYIEKLSPYKLAHAMADIKAHYQLSYIDSIFALQIDDAYLTLSDIQVAYKETQQSFVNINKVEIGPTTFNLLEQSARLEKITIDSVDLELLRDPQGQLTLLAPLAPFMDKKTKENNQASAFLWSIDKISVNNSKITLTDQSIPSGATIVIDNVAAELLQLNQSLANEQPFSVFYRVGNNRLTSAQNSINGHVVLQPFSMQSDLRIASLPLAIAQPYISPVANVEIKSGLLSVTANSDIALQKNAGITGQVTALIGINEFDSRDTMIKRRLLGWKALDISPIKIDLEKRTVAIKKVTLDTPYSRLIISQDKQINFSQLMVNKETSNATDSSTPFNIDIADIQLKNGSAYFADLSLLPAFATSIDNIHGNIKGLSSNNLERADVNIRGTVEEYGKMLIDGKINPLGGDLYTDININFDKIELTTLTPYSGRYAGYVIDKGKLSLELKYKIAKGILDGHNRLVLDQFELGAAVDSKEALNLPIKLALALFKDSDGIIDISLPTKGDMNSPDFEIGGLILKALLNVMTKAISSPFSLLANLAGGDEQQLSSVTFAVGEAQLSAEQIANLKTLSELLIKRPQLVLEIRVNVDAIEDALILKTNALNELLAANNNPDASSIERLETLVIEREGESSLEKIQQSLIQPENETPLEPEQAALQYQQHLYARLLASQPFTALALSELAQQRVSVIKGQLIKNNQVDNSQVFALQPSLEGKAENNGITTVFTLTSH